MNKDLLTLAPKLKTLTDDVLYHDIWERRLLNKRERSIATLSVLISLGRFEQLPHHINLAKQHNVNEYELIELFTHLAFYSGWPAAMSALKQLRDNQ
ncbi:carboxymuconolactone decarboxylase family protein [Psychromonas sp. B3M02]|uniref:carboxymuconolactone decarboxylase family protein n=1 Tax=Psychromonas sp. B3M02 TaxID=2267226 RepID=UPI000DE8CBF6|nr:carboxymuconolactone decarboxylase family protein [Psychromonas sp. B3M02]RBW43450.1 carboxymuconolactone decarboxylase family protein [Psychromonas sp. B3M02]